MSRIKSVLKIVAINLALIVFLLALVLFVPALWSDARQALKGTAGGTGAGKHALPLYEKEPWARQHFIEIGRLSTRYHDFIGWRRAKFDGETITIDENGFRRHPSQADSPAKARIWVLGGSTVWGTGSRDGDTIPAQLEKITRKGTFNFGESAYIAHQSLNLLMREYVAGGRPEAVIFYDGVNEVVHKCRSELNFYSSGHEQQIRGKVQGDGDSDSQFLGLFRPLVAQLSEGLRKRNKDKGSDGYFDCHRNPEKAALIARNLIQDWETARRLVEKNGGKFIAALQPVSYIGTPNLEHLPEKKRDAALKPQFEAVYPLIREQARKAKFEYLDLTAVFDGREPVYIDFCHVIPAGNGKIALALSKKL